MIKGPTLLVDGHGLAFRAFYALPELSASDGTPTNALVGFFNMLWKVRKKWAPGSMTVVFDAPGPTFRHELYEHYKEGRKPTPEELKRQIPVLKDLLRLLGIPTVSLAGVEADDVLGALARHEAAQGSSVLLLTSDKDMLQILGPGITVIRPGKGISSFTQWDEETFKEEYGFDPAHMADYLALVGDSVDNVPGVPGIGDKTARRLLAAYGDLEGILAHRDTLSSSQAKRLGEHEQDARRSLKLTTLDTTALPEEEDWSLGAPDLDAFTALCGALEMNTVVVKGAELLGGDTVDMPRASSTTISVAQTPTPSILEELLKEDELVVHGEWVGGYPMDLRPAPLAVVARDGRYTLLDRIPEELVRWMDGGKLVTSDYKRFLAAMGKESAIPRVWDLRSADYLLHPDRSSHDLKSVMGDELPETSEARAMALWNLQKTMVPDLERLGANELLRELDLPLVPVLVSMERWGIRVDSVGLAQVVSDLKDRLGRIVQAVDETAGESVNLNSPKQVAELLFNRLGLPPVKKTKTGFSTDVTVLEQLSELPQPHGTVPSMLLEHRELSKMLSGFAVPLLNASEGDGLIHSTFEGDTTGTGRLSSRDPNLQNLPAYGQWSDRIKNTLLPREPGRCFVAADYSQIELRVLAHISGEDRLAQIFRDRRDIHTETAAMVFGVDPSMVTRELRRSAKMVAFGLLYGMSSFGLAKRLGVSRSEADRIMTRYFKALPGVEDYVNTSTDRSMSRGYTETLFGRIRQLDEVETGNARDRGHLRRVAVNSPIQGTAADLAKKAMIAVAREFQGEAVHMVLQVHDSIVCECPVERVEEILERLQTTMKSVATLSVPLETEGTFGPTLAQV
ncbi:MAG: DNA polymerase I [Dethiosulfovibrio peptidovorans]|nr:MAG: DNA polymerase I [Dethiosulfovibrio peptidovorans]